MAHHKTDLTGGIDPDRELMFASCPEDPEMRDSASFWVLDECGEVGLPRIGIEAVASNWEAHQIQVNVAFADGRVYRLRDEGKSWPVEGPDGRATVLGAGPLAFTCVRPFDTWTLSFDGRAVATSSEALAAGNADGPLVDVAFQVEAAMAVPPWIQGTMQADADRSLKNTIVGNLMGGPRYEQLFRATGSVRVADRPEQTFNGTGLRIRRQGVRRLGGVLGPLLAVGTVSQRKGVRLHRLSAAARRRTSVQRGLHLLREPKRRQRPGARAGRRGALADPAASGAG